MEDEKKDVGSDSSTDEKDKTRFDDADIEKIEAEESETDEKEEETQESDESKDEEEETKEDEEESEDESEVLKAKLAKSEEEKENLLKALQEKRKAERTSQAPLIQQQPTQTVDFAKAIVESEEESAKATLFEEFPELKPENDPNNVVYGQFAKDFALAAQVRGVTPVRKEQFVELGRLVMNLRKGGTDAAKVKAEARAEAHKEHLKADAANIGGTSSSKRDEQPTATEADRRAARAVGMDIKQYLKYKDRYEDGIPL